VFSYKIEEGPKSYEVRLGGRKFTMYDDTVIGYGETGEELFRAKVEEPMHIRKKDRTNAV